MWSIVKALEMLRCKVPLNVAEALEIFVKRVVEFFDGDVEVYLFGSFARGDWLEDSDIDIIVVSPRLENVPWLERYPMLRRLAPDWKPFDILAYTPREVEVMVSEGTFLTEVMQYWVRLYP